MMEAPSVERSALLPTLRPKARRSPAPIPPRQHPPPWNHIPSIISKPVPVLTPGLLLTAGQTMQRIASSGARHRFAPVAWRGGDRRGTPPRGGRQRRAGRLRPLLAAVLPVRSGACRPFHALASSFGLSRLIRCLSRSSLSPKPWEDQRPCGIGPISDATAFMQSQRPLMTEPYRRACQRRTQERNYRPFAYRRSMSSLSKV
jgi:hypothetical protein